MRKSSDNFGKTDEDTEMQSLPLYTEKKADGIYRYRRRVPKDLVDRVGKGYLYRNLGRTKKEITAKWSAVHSEIEKILSGARESGENSNEIYESAEH